ncbi:MAG: DUF1349 domain-containing protein, partial [Planctomycetaceae bacterium]|nr:DUF1349 domain-containing protein [Planctomycetaceae bacterium]
MITLTNKTLISFSLLTLLCLTTIANAEEKKQKVIPGWDSISDLDDDCKISTAIIITVPNTNHDLNPRNRLNAPRLLKKVSGDFTVQVKVTGGFIPGEKPTGKGTPFNGAGLLIWENNKSYLRLERNAFGKPESLSCFPPLLEYWSEGKYKGFNAKTVRADEFFQDYTTWLKLQRKGKQMIASYSHDGKEWTVVKEFEVDFGNDISAGIAAVNTSNAEFKVAFENFKLTTDSPKEKTETDKK